MVKVESRIENRTAGATKRDPATVKGKIVEFLIRMTNQGYHESSVKIYSNILKWLIRAGANLWDPESVKKAIAQKKWSVKTKAMAVGVYNAFARVNGLDWDTPKYQAYRKLPFIPLESEIDALIAGCGRKTSTVLQLLKETGMRIGEATPLTWIDVDLERKTITVNEPEKAGTPRRIKISTSSWQCLNNYRKQLNAYYAEQRQSAHAAPFESKENDLQQNFRIQGCCTFGSTRSAIGKPQWNIIKPKISCK